MKNLMLDLRKYLDWEEILFGIVFLSGCMAVYIGILLAAILLLKTSKFLAVCAATSPFIGLYLYTEWMHFQMFRRRCREIEKLETEVKRG